MRNREDAFDITKMILSIFVIGAHAGLYPDIMNPLYRIAVPMFFMMSSYFFFKSLGQDKTANKARLKKFVVRNLRLYGFWFVALLPLTLIIRDYFAQGFVPGLLTLLHNFLFYSTFRASWYLIALCTAMVILYFLSGVTGNKGLLWISAPIYVLYCLFSNYYGLFGECDLWNSFCNGYRTVFVTLCNNFPAGFLWITLGKMFAEGKISIPAKVTRWMLPLSVMLLYAEQITVLHYGLADKTDYYFALVPCCIALFSLLRGADVHCSTAPLLRKTSTVVYVLHSSAISVLNLIGGRFLHIPEGWMAVYLTASSLMVCIAATFIILRLEKQKGFRWLRYAY